MGKVEMGIDRGELADVVEFLRKVEVDSRPLTDMGQNVMLYMVMRELRELRGMLGGIMGRMAKQVEKKGKPHDLR